MSCYEVYIDDLRAMGYRLTPQRLMVLELLFHHNDYMTVESMYEQVKTQYAKVNISTIYRSVNFLAAKGLVTELRRGGEETLYAAVREKPHAHAICQHCGAVLPIDATVLQPAMAAVARTLKFAVMVGSIELPGLCRNCVQYKVVEN